MSDAFVAPIRSFDVHCYFDAKEEKEVQFAQKLRESIQQEFPELTVYKMHHGPIGPHPIGMFEVDVATPAQFGALIPWLAIRHGSLSVLVHPNTEDVRADHTLNATWMGEKLLLNMAVFDRLGY